MSVQINSFVPKTFGSSDYIITGSFQTNGGTSGAIDATTIASPRGTVGMTVTQSASVAGLYTIALPFGATFPHQPWVVGATPQFAVLATDWFQVSPLGVVSYANGILTFAVQCHRSGTANAPAATAGNRINFTIVAGNTTGG